MSELSKKDLATVCGLCCVNCFGAGKLCKEPCSVAKGKMVWGQCQIYTCCAEKGLEHCGLCSDVPNCKPMTDIEAIEKKFGIPIGNKIRMENLKRRMEIGTEKWVEEQEAKI